MAKPGIHVPCSSLLPQPLVRCLYSKGKDMTCSNKRWNKPLIELVHRFQVHVVWQPHILIYEVKGSVSYELVQMTMVVLRDSESSTRLTFP